ncbi:MAG: SAF domain-containing protein [Bacillota bacterium]
MSKKAAIVASIVLALIFTLLITGTANRRYAVAARTVDVVQVEQYIPVGSVISEKAVKTVKVPEKVANDLVRDPDEAIGKVAKVGLVKGQYVWKHALGEGLACRPGYVEVHVPTDLSSSACVIAGDIVDVYPVVKSSAAGEPLSPGAALAQGLRVLHSLDQGGEEIDPAKKAALAQVAATGKNVPVSVALEVPQALAQQVVSYASRKAVYLVKCPPSGGTPGA